MNENRRLVYVCWFIREYEDRDDTKLLIGIYGAADEARAAIEGLKGKPGFRDYLDGFEIHETPLGRTSWAEGFIATFGPPPKDAASEAFDLPYWLNDLKS